MRRALALGRRCLADPTFALAGALLNAPPAR